MRRANVISGVVLAVFGLVVLFAIIPWQIAAGPEGMMSPRTVPAIMMAVVIALSALLVFNNLRAGSKSADPDDTPPISKSEFLAMGKFGVLFAVAITLHVWVSPLAGGAALIVGALLALGERRWFVLAAMPASLLLAIWFLFYRVLGTAIL